MSVTWAKSRQICSVTLVAPPIPTPCLALSIYKAMRKLRWVFTISDDTRDYITQSRVYQPSKMAGSVEWIGGQGSEAKRREWNGSHGAFRKQRSYKILSARLCIQGTEFQNCCTKPG
jgi:hypothetical protein